MMQPDDETVEEKRDVRQRMRESITGTIGDLRDRAGEMIPDMSDVRSRVGSATDAVRENPLGLFIGAVAIGFVVGSLIPTTSIEDERLGQISDQLKAQAQERVVEVAQTVRDATTQAISDAMN